MTSDNGQYHLTIHDLPTDERPRERLKNYGAASLSNAELIAILLRTGIKGENVLNLSARLLTEYGGLLGLARAEFTDLAAKRGLGPAKASQLKAALELARRYKGNANAAIIRAGEVFRPAIKAAATATILVHNHPSGDPTPSPEDVQVTRRLIDAGKMLDIAVLDHIVIGNQRYVSMKERGLI